MPNSILSVYIALTLISAGSAGEVVSDRLIAALIAVESGGDDKAIGDKGKAVGCLQIWPIIIRDCNRIIGQNKYTLKDRLNRQKSIEICKIVLSHYEVGDEAQARRWNGGTNWRQKPETIKYWNKVRRAMKCTTK